MDSLRKNARIAGFLYLLVIVVGPLRLIYIPGTLFVEGNAAATARNVAAHETLFRFGMVSDLLGATLMLAVVLALYRLFKGVDHDLAALMVILGGLMVTPIYFLNTLNDAAALMLIRGGDFLSVFDAAQRNALALLFIDLHHSGEVVNEIFWGLWLFPFGVLVYRSGFLPRILGAWLIVAGFAYPALSMTALLLPQYEDLVFRITSPVMLGEVAIMLWLLIVGARGLSESTNR